jgi:hypothetical protein
MGAKNNAKKQERKQQQERERLEREGKSPTTLRVQTQLDERRLPGGDIDGLDYHGGADNGGTDGDLAGMDSPDRHDNQSSMVSWGGRHRE